MRVRVRVRVPSWFHQSSIRVRISSMDTHVFSSFFSFYQQFLKIYEKNSFLWFVPSNVIGRLLHSFVIPSSCCFHVFFLHNILIYDIKQHEYIAACSFERPRFKSCFFQVNPAVACGLSETNKLKKLRCWFGLKFSNIEY